jgi:outer membrane protein assembly factor BamC
MYNVTRFPLNPLAKALAAALTLGLAAAGCSSIETAVTGEKVDYKAATVKATPLEVPPDLTQLQNDSRYNVQSGGTISATTFQNPQAAGNAAPAAGPATQSVAPNTLGQARLERQGDQRWVVTTQTPEQVWPQLQAFWKERGLTISLDQPEAGVMETEWAENRAKLPDDLLRRTLGRVIDGLYSTGERDKYRTRVERGANGTEIHIAHRGLREVYVGQQKESTTWEPRPSEPDLEGEMLTRLLVKLGAKDEQAKLASQQAASAPAAATPHARAIEGQAAASLQVDDAFDRAWRRVGLALDRSGFTVEDRDRTQGVYFVRYVDPAMAGKEEPGFFSRLFGTGEKGNFAPVKYRVRVVGQGDVSLVSVLDSKGEPENGDAGKRIVGLLVDELK